MDALAHLAIIWCSVYAAVFIAAKTRLTSVLIFLGIGALLVNIGVLPEQSHPFIQGFAELGIVLIMFALGFEESPRRFVAIIKRSWGIALFGALAPFTVAYAVADYFWHETNISLMCGLAMTATAVSLTMVSLKSVGLEKSSAATGIMSSAVLDDIASLAMVAVLVPIVTGQTTLEIAAIGVIGVKVVIFFAIVIFLELFLFPDATTGAIYDLPLVRLFSIRSLLQFDDGKHATLSVLVIALLMGLLSHAFGFHPAVGAYMAGLVLKEEYFHFRRISQFNYYERTKDILESAAFSWIGPVFFVHLGTKIVFDWAVFVAVIPQTFVLLIGLFVAQVASAALAARYTGGFTRDESVLIGFGMLGRAELAFVVMDIAYVQNSIITTEVFYTLMMTAFWLNVSVPITIAWWKPRLAELEPG